MTAQDLVALKKRCLFAANHGFAIGNARAYVAALEAQVGSRHLEVIEGSPEHLLVLIQLAGTSTQGSPRRPVRPPAAPAPVAPVEDNVSVDVSVEVSEEMVATPADSSSTENLDRPAKKGKSKSKNG